MRRHGEKSARVSFRDTVHSSHTKLTICMLARKYDACVVRHCLSDVKPARLKDELRRRVALADDATSICQLFRHDIIVSEHAYVLHCVQNNILYTPFTLTLKNGPTNRQPNVQKTQGLHYFACACACYFFKHKRTTFFVTVIWQTLVNARRVQEKHMIDLLFVCVFLCVVAIILFCSGKWCACVRACVPAPVLCRTHPKFMIISPCASALHVLCHMIGLVKSFSDVVYHG